MKKKMLVLACTAALTALAAFADGFFEKAGNPIDRDPNATTCRIEIRYDLNDPTAVAIDTSARNPIARCALYLDKIAIAAANMRMAAEPGGAGIVRRP